MSDANDSPVDGGLPDIGEQVTLRRPHPCGCRDFTIARTGADIGLTCLGCGKRIFLTRDDFDRRRQIVSGTAKGAPVTKSGTAKGAPVTKNGGATAAALLLLLALAPSLLGATSAPVRPSAFASKPGQERGSTIREIEIDLTGAPEPREAAPDTPADTVPSDAWDAWALADLPAAAAAEGVRLAYRPDTFGLVLSPADASNLLSLKLKRGLWRFSVAVRDTDGAMHSWRLQPEYLKDAGVVRKTIAIVAPGGGSFRVRGEETLGAAERACRIAQSATENAPRAGRLVARVRARIGDAQRLCAKGDRAKIVRPLQEALLTLGQAEALARNEETLTGGEGEAVRTAFENLTAALSEASAAALNLVPGQKIVRRADGSALLEVSLTNAGRTTVADIALMASASGERRRFASVPPGRRVAATFTIENPDDADGVVQYIVRYGQAAIPTRIGPPPAPSTPPTDPEPPSN